MTRYAFASLAIAVALPVRAGVVLKYEDGDKKQTTVELQGKKLRTYSQRAEREGGSAIFDGDRQVFYSLDDKTKTYRRMDQAAGAEMADEMKAAMEKAKARMTPEQRARMEAFMATQQPPTARTPKEHAWKFERTAGGQKVAGYSCENYRVLRDGKPESEVCFVPWSGGGFKKDDFVALQEMGRFFEKTFASMGQRPGKGARHSASDQWVTHFLEDAPGFPAVMDRIDEGGKRTQEMRLVNIQRTSVADSEFAVPPGYTEQRNPWGGG